MKFLNDNEKGLGDSKNPLKIASLISGGKDSLYAMYKAKKENARFGKGKRNLNWGQ